MFTLEELDSALPPKLKGKMLTPEIATTLNMVITDANVAEHFRNNFISYTNVLQEGKFKIEDYISAVIYVGYKLMNYSDKECYMRTFPQKYQELIAAGTSAKDVASYVSAVNRGKLVNLVLEQTLIPSWVLNQDVYQKAINAQLEIMTTSKSDMARTKAADSILNHLKRPEASKVELTIGMKDSEDMIDFKDQMRKLVESQQASILAGVATKDIAHQRLINVTPDEADS